jgi:hypothetical protein
MRALAAGRPGLRAAPVDAATDHERVAYYAFVPSPGNDVTLSDAAHVLILAGPDRDQLQRWVDTARERAGQAGLQARQFDEQV